MLAVNLAIVHVVDSLGSLLCRVVFNVGVLFGLAGVALWGVKGPARNGKSERDRKENRKDSLVCRLLPYRGNLDRQNFAVGAEDFLQVRFLNVAGQPADIDFFDLRKIGNKSMKWPGMRADASEDLHGRLRPSRAEVLAWRTPQLTLGISGGGGDARRRSGDRDRERRPGL